MTAPTTVPGFRSLQVTRQSVTLRQRVCDKLRQAIFERRLAPGTKLVERDLCEQLGVSRPSLREALRHLESEKLIEMVPHRGSVVARLSERDVREIYDVRAALEGPACARFADLATDEDIASLEQAYAQLDKAVQQNDRAGILQAKAAFYQTLFHGSGCVISQSIVASLNVRIEVLRRMSIARTGRYPQMIAEIGSIVDAARGRNGAAMRESCIAHLKSAAAAALEQQRSLESSKSSPREDPKENAAKQQGETL